MQTFEVVMIGNTAVGKTSMLSTLANELEDYNLSGKVVLEPTTREFKVLQEQWNEMTAQVASQRPFTTLSSSIQGTAVDFVEHEFDFKVDGSKKAAVLFTDTRGGMTGELDEKLVSRVNNAFGVFCVVDASVLMECPVSQNDRFNCPKFVKRLLKEVYCDGDDKQPRFILFVLTKCEKYMATKKGQKELSDKFHEVYDNIADMLCKANTPPNIYVLGIQTMTCVSFLKLNETTGLPEFRVLPAKVLETKDCAYPLVILLKKLIDEIESGRGFWGRIWRKLRFVTDLRKYRDEVDKQVATPDFFEEL